MEGCVDNGAIIADVILSEVGPNHLLDGAFALDPADPGGVTRWGITVPALTDYWLDRAQPTPPSPNDIKALTRADAEAFYLWLMADTKVAQIPNDIVRWITFDAVVHMGDKPGIRLLQRALGVKDDGVLGPATLGACPVADGAKLARLVLTEQALFYGRLASKNLTDADKDGIPDQLEFLNGYMERWARKNRAVA